MNLVILLTAALLWVGGYYFLRRSRINPFLTELVAAAGLLALMTVGFFWQVLLTENAWMPAGGGDLAPFLYPNYYFAAEHLRQGILPLWNPHLYSGVPFAADIQSGLFYPINWIIFFLVPEVTFEWLEYLAIFHFWLAGSMMYLCLRLLQLSPAGQTVAQEATPHTHEPIPPLAAFFGAVAFEFSDLFIVHFGNLNMIAVAAWLPLIFLLYHLGLRRKSYGLAMASGAFLAIATLAGHIQITLFILLTLALYTIFEGGFAMLAAKPAGLTATNTLSSNQHPQVSNIQKSQSPDYQSLISNLLKQGVSPISHLLITLLVTISLSALLFLPAYEMSQYTPRAELPYAEAAEYSLHPVQLVGLLIPNYFGRDPALHWGPWQRVETGYIGIITLLLSLIGAVFLPHRLKYFFIGLAAIALLLAMGGYSVVHGWLYAILPGFNQLRAPARFILLLDFALAVLAAFGLKQLMQAFSDKAQALLQKLLKPLTWGLGGLIVVALPLSYYALLITQDRNPVIFNRAIGAASGVTTFSIFAALALIILYLIHNKWLRETKGGVALTLLLILDLFTLGSNVDVGHTNPVQGFDHPQAIAFLQADSDRFRTEVTTDVWHLWQPDTGLLHGLDDVWGLYNPLTLADTTLYWSGAPPRNSGRYNFLGIKYIIASKAGAPADGNIIPVFNEDPDINIYLNQDALARAIFVGHAIVVSDHDQAWQGRSVR